MQRGNGPRPSAAPAGWAGGSGRFLDQSAAAICGNVPSRGGNDRQHWLVYHRLIALRRRHRYYEYHVRLRGRTDPRNRHSQSHWRQTADHLAAVSTRGGEHLSFRRVGWLEHRLAVDVAHAKVL